MKYKLRAKIIKNKMVLENAGTHVQRRCPGDVARSR